MAGSLKRANPTLDEDVVLIRAFKDSNLPKFLAQDVHLFLAIISEAFPGVVIPEQDFGDLQASIEKCLVEAGLQPVPAYVIKVIQLYETMNVRFGVMAVGPTGGGKTSCYKTLQLAMTKLRIAKHTNQSFQITHSYVLNPKCIKMGELYGEYNLMTNEWTDGLASTIMRMCVADTTMERKWVVFDGPVDAIWIENMNTVLDDNCILCLPNGERIKLNPTTMRMLFEVQDLAVASPATVSRCGMVYVPPEELGWRPYVMSWMQRLPKAWNVTPEDIPEPVTELIWKNFDTPTQDSTRMGFLMEVNLEVDRAVLFQGVSGAGKSAIIYDLLNRLRENKNCVSIVLNFSAQTTSIATQEAIESKLEKKRKTRYGAPVGKKIVCFVDDVNMPAKERYGAQPPIELLRQFLDFKGFYDRLQLFWKDIEDMTLVSACAPPGGGRNEVTPRYFRHFTMLCVQPPSETALRTIFGAILGGFLQLFSAECKQYQKPIVECTIEVYVRMSQELLPTPAKSHYTFNLRDVSKVFQGILMVKPGDCNTKKALRGLWVHECMRVFHDRLINAEDRSYFTQMLHDLMKRSLEENATHQEVFEDKTLMYGDYIRPGVAPEDRRYELVQDPPKLGLLFKDYLEDYNMTTTNIMRLVFFKDAIEHVSRIARILRQPRGNAMLVGVGGSGKQSLTRFAAFLAEFKCFQIELKKGYNMNDFREDLKKLYKLTGVEGNSAVFLFTDTQIVNEGFVEDINNLLNSGEVPGLYASDEKDRISADMREHVSKLGLPETKDVLYSSFINRTRDNLHVVLCMSPIGDAFRARCRQFPSLINCCTIDWFNEWPEEALLSVSQHFLAPVDLSSDEIRAKVAKICVEIHISVSNAADKFYQELRRKYYITPKSYLDCVNLYIQLLADKRQESYVAEDRFNNGLYKLKETNELIDGMKIDLNKLQPILAEKAEATAKLLAQVARDQESAQKVKEVVQTEEADVKSQAEATQLIKDDAQKDLDAAMPALNAAVQALNSLNKNDITEIKSFTKPPPLVLLTMEGVCVLLGEKPDWDTSKKVMSDVQFIKRLIEYDKDAITPLIQKKLVRYIEDPNFLPEIVQKQSAAATSLCMWVRAMDVYAKVAKVVAPKKETLRKAEEALKIAAEKLASKQKQLADVEAQVEVLKKNLQNTEAEQKALQDQAALTENRLVRAGKLTSALADESVRWRETADDIATKRILFVGDVFICAACISYYGAFSGVYREALVNQWVARLQGDQIPVSEICSLRAILSTPVEVREWSIWGLPTDDVSVDNGILVTRGKRWPLMIDPQGQANNWVKAMESKNGLRVLRLNDPNLLRTLESSIRIGNPVLLEDLGDTIDPSLEPILQKQIFEKKGRFLIRLGDTDVDYDPNFKLYMTTKMSNPHYMPDICIKVTLVNFTVTMKGLEDQLLGDVVRKERADLEEQNDRLVVSISSDKKQLKDLEDKILKLLKESEGNILDDEVLINTLNTSKVTSAVIQKRVKQAEITEKEITAARELYRVVAKRGSILYFVISDLALIDSMYQYSLSFFSQLFNRCIDISEKADELDIRLGILIKFITEFLYANVSRGLFEEHKVTFSFLICTSILRYEGEISPPEWSFFLRGASSLPKMKPPNPAPDILSEKMWNDVCALEDTFKDYFAGVTKAMADQMLEWKAFLKVPEPHNTPFPSHLDDRILPFHRLLLMKTLREEKVVYAVENYIRLKLGPSFIGSSPLQLEEVFKDSTNTTPVIFILSTGADPTGMLQRFAEKVDKKPGERLHMISLGQGQGPIAEMLMAKSRKAGDWVCLQNCHLASSWMTTLERLVEKFIPEREEIHPEFRLWLTSLPSKYFPVPVLQNGIKITNEPPKGVRANLLQSYANIPEDYIENCTKRGPWKKLVFSIAFFHAVIQERRKFGPLGWNVKYDFNSSDLECAMQTLHMFLEEQEEIPWPALLYVTGEITYGGRVTDDLDRRCLLSTLRRYYDPAVLSDEYAFTPSRTYMSPPEGMYTFYVEYIKRLPATEGPDVFGMHENANLTFQLQETSKVFNTVLGIQPRTTAVAAGGKTPDEIVSELAMAIAEKLPGPLKLDPESPALVLGLDGQLTSLAIVLTQESERFNKLLKVITFTLLELQRAIKGLVVMSAELESMFNNFLNNQVPALWQAVAYPSLKPLSSWIIDFHKRMEFMSTWIKEGTPKCFWLPGFFFPQGFMTGALQTHARKYQIPIDTLNFGFKVMTMEDLDEVDVPPEDGVYISGLFLDGARWDRKHRWLTEALPGKMHSKLPVVHFIPVVNYKPPADEYQCPLYKTHVRAGVLTTTGASSNYILNISLRISPETNPDYWVLQGIAGLCLLGD
ncbi:LOW QUALITY PROTEIN: dynein heavy chain 6, axonemal, partial [Selaginella moellendorffii]|uniref:LOW QUALITY PROTEIN: dynein heavy chain 6, axonemal n=1 Tax=Selaginella moellendorffii TaxID=88036 RepID=UPI000D1CB303